MINLTNVSVYSEYTLHTQKYIKLLVHIQFLQNILTYKASELNS